MSGVNINAFMNGYQDIDTLWNVYQPEPCQHCKTLEGRSGLLYCARCLRVKEKKPPGIS